jgi:hypothetical protein
MFQNTQLAFKGKFPFVFSQKFSRKLDTDLYSRQIYVCFSENFKAFAKKDHEISIHWKA